ncbi:MAG: phosphoribosylaminoimidazolesuccinocarboxamide synthase [Candidatus Melainabacteria bacterium]|nr:phosphoribosylaminoimidazolesuccinocarboxamide synthase [Candidatus Melainabacteria bacterium]
MPTATKPIYSGKAKDIFETDDSDVLRAYFRDSATAFNAQKKGEIHGKGKVNATISALLFTLVEKNGIKTHFIKQISDNELLVKRVQIIPLEVIVRNIAAGSLCKRLGIKEGKVLKTPIVEFSYKNDELGDPLLTRAYIKNALEIADDKTLDYITEVTLKANEIFKDFFLKNEIKVVDFKLEYGTDKDGNLLLADELSPDNFRFWDAKTNEKLDKDRFRQDLGNVEGAYQEILKRVKSGIQDSAKPQHTSTQAHQHTSTSAHKHFNIKVQVLPKKDILDPQGQAVEKALISLGYKDVRDLKIGKEIVFKVSADSELKAKSQVKEMCEKLLANPVIEDYLIEIK